MALWIECLGGFALLRDGAALALPSRKAQILLGLLACARHRSLPRIRVAALLWEHADRDGARINLRQALSQIRRAGGDGLVEVDGDTLRLGADVFTDIGGFSDALARGDDAGAARLYRGPLLDGALPEGADLAAAVLAERARLASLAAAALTREMDRLGDGGDAEQVAHRLLAIEPLFEPAHRRLMLAEAARGARGAARARFDALGQALRRDLGAEPAPETVALMDRIRRVPGKAPSSNPTTGSDPEPEATATGLLLVAMEADGAVDWDGFRDAALHAGAEDVTPGTGEASARWNGAALRQVATAALGIADRLGASASLGLADAAGPPARDLSRARRIAASAGPGTVWLDPALAPRLGFDAGETPVPLSRAGLAARPGIPFVGRSLELAQIEAALKTARGAGSGLAIHLGGEAGIGKSRLAAEIAAREAARGIRVVRAGFEPLGKGDRHIAQDLMAALPPPPDGIVTSDTLRAVLAWLREPAVPAEAALRLSALGDEVRRARTLDLLAATLGGGAHPSGLLVVIEDAHWAPTGIGDVLLQLCDRLADRNVAVILTERPHGADLGRRLAARARIQLVRLVLGPLPQDEAARLAASATPDRRSVTAVLDRAAGHPLFLLRLLEAGWSDGRLPRSVEALVLEQLEDLDPADRAMLGNVAVLGRAFDMDDATGIFPGGPPPRAMGDLLHATETGFAFSHDLVRQAIYDALPEDTRRARHGRVAAHHRGGDPLRWADHALLADDDAEAARAAAAAANAMISDLRLTRATGYIEAGLARGTDPEAMAELHSCRAGIRRTRGDLHGALDDYRTAHARALSEPTRVAMLVRQALVLHRLGRGSEADRALDAAEEIADRIGLAGLGRAEIHEQRGNRAFASGLKDACLRHHAKGLAAAKAAGDIRGIARAHGGMGDAHVLSGRLGTASDHFERAVALAGDAGLGIVYQEYSFMRGYTLFFAEPGPRAHLLADLAVESTAEAGAGRAEMLARNVRAELRLAALDLDGARADIERIATLIDTDPETRFVSDIALMRGWLFLREGDTAAAHAELAPHLDAARQSSYNGAMLLALGALSAPDSERWHALLRAADERAAAGAMASAEIGFHCLALEAAARTGDADRARRHMARLRAMTGAEPLGLVTLALRAADLRWNRRQAAADDMGLRAELEEARLAGLAFLLECPE